MSIDQLIRITSWNVAGKDPLNGTNLDYLFDDTKRTINLSPDIQIVGLQEAPQYLFSDPWSTNLSTTLKKRGYILFKRHKLSGILLYIFVLREIMLRARDFETESVKTGFGGLLGNKGGVSLRFTLNGNSFSVTNSHLAAHQENLQQRIDDYNSILDGTKYTVDANTSNILTHDYAFWFGDLNFRFDSIEKHDVLNIITNAKTSGSNEVKTKIISALHKNDQLTSVKKKGKAFADFNETLPEFFPTYKFRIGSKDAYDSDNRIPAWTDRVLYRYHPSAYNGMIYPEFKPKLEQLFYDSLTETDLSDHKPIASMFRVSTFDPKKINPSAIPYEVIKFEPIMNWKAGEDGRLWYKISNDLFYRRPKVLSSWDRLGLYKADFGSLEDYLTIAFVNNIARVAPQLNAQEVSYQSSRSSTPSGSRRGSTSSTGSAISAVSVGTEAITLNSSTTASANLRSAQVNEPLPPDAIIGDGFKYFSVAFSDDTLLPGRYVILYLKTNAANEYNVYGISDPFNIASN